MFGISPALLSAAKDPYYDKVVSLFTFDGVDGGTTMVDHIGGLTWTNHGVVLKDTRAKFGLTSAFFTSDSYLLSSASSDLSFGDFTVEAWVYVTDISGSTTLFDNRLNSSDTVAEAAGLYTSVSSYATYTNTTIPLVEGASTFPTNTWTHIAFTRSGSTIRVFVNGAQDGSGTDSRTFDTPLKAVIGNNFIYPFTGSSSQQFLGYIDSLRITKDVARYTSAFSPPNNAFPTR